MAASKVFREASVPEAFSAKVLKVDDDGVDLSVVWKQNDLITQKTKKFSTHYKLNRKTVHLEQVGFPVEINAEIVLEAFSPSKTKCAFIKKVQTSIGKEEFILEIWSSSKCTKTINLSSLEMHGVVHSDIITFSSFSWHPNEQCLLYLAEQNKSIQGTNAVIDNKYAFEESWGELLNEITTPVICVVDILKEKVNLISSPTFQNISPCQPQWGPGPATIIFCGVQILSYRLGIIYCNNRPSDIFVLKYNNDFKVDIIINITETFFGISCNWSPRINKSLTKISYLHRNLSEEGSPHMSEVKLFCYNIPNETNTCILPSETIKEGSVDCYTGTLSPCVWFEDNIHIAVKDVNTFRVINSETHRIVTSYEQCTELLGVHNSLAIFSTSLLDYNTIKLVVYDHENSSYASDRDLSNHANIEKQKISVNRVENVVSWGLIPTTTDQKIPLIVWAHGGPHSVFTDSYDVFATSFCQMGYAVLLTNYTGSIGFGSSTSSALPGKIGEKDVNDVQDMALAFLAKNIDRLDADNVFFFGGSHGGFIGAHLMGQFPDFYKAAVLRNPVVEIASMSMVTDIPDWCYFESGLPYNQGKLPNENDYAVMLRKSPITRLRNIKAPILICIGGKDLRVPPSQGKGFYRLLKGNDKEVKLLLFPNACHPLKNVEIVEDFFVNSCKWFDHYKKM